MMSRFELHNIAEDMFANNAFIGSSEEVASSFVLACLDAGEDVGSIYNSCITRTVFPNKSNAAAFQHFIDRISETI